MKDANPYVRDTTAWTIGRVFEFQHDASNTDVPELITRETLPQVAQVLMGGLQDQVHIAVRVCDCIGRLADGFSGYAGGCWTLQQPASEQHGQCNPVHMVVAHRCAAAPSSFAS